jgi:hypothetical protein
MIKKRRINSKLKNKKKYKVNCFLNFFVVTNKNNKKQNK